MDNDQEVMKKGENLNNHIKLLKEERAEQDKYRSGPEVSVIRDAMMLRMDELEREMRVVDILIEVMIRRDNDVFEKSSTAEIQNYLRTTAIRLKKIFESVKVAPDTRALANLIYRSKVEYRNKYDKYKETNGDMIEEHFFIANKIIEGGYHK